MFAVVLLGQLDPTCVIDVRIALGLPVGVCYSSFFDLFGAVRRGGGVVRRCRGVVPAEPARLRHILQ